MNRFFTPSIVELKQRNTLFLLCLSTGNADGLGKIRQKELDASCKYLGFQEWDCIDDPELPDGMKEQWSADKIAEHIE